MYYYMSLCFITLIFLTSFLELMQILYGYPSSCKIYTMQYMISFIDVYMEKN